MKKSKRYLEQKNKIEDKLYPIKDSIDLIKDIASAKFDESVEMHLITSADPKNADEQIRTVADLPHGTGKKIRVLVFAEGDAAVTAKESGADYISDDEIVKKIEGGWLDFDVAIATPDQMSKIGKLGKYLGRKGLMPNPKTGTVVQPQNIAQSIEASRKGRTEIKLDSSSVIHFNVGKSSFSDIQLFENLKSVIKTIYDNNLAPFSPWLKGISVFRKGVDVISDPEQIKKDFEDHFWNQKQAITLQKVLKACKNQCYKCHKCDDLFSDRHVQSILEA